MLVGLYEDQKNYFYISKYNKGYNYLNTIFKKINPNNFLDRVIDFFKKQNDFMEPVLKAFSQKPETYIEILKPLLESSPGGSDYPKPINFAEDLGMIVFYQDGDSRVANNLGWIKKAPSYNCIPFSIPFDVVTYPHRGVDMDLKRGWYKLFKNFLKKADLKDLCKRVMGDNDQARAFKDYLELYMKKTVSNDMFSLGVRY
ncbi:hypothetical protein GF352_04440 [archaeon]|nr:hypothetical protein [archaeon]